MLKRVGVLVLVGVLAACPGGGYAATGKAVAQPAASVSPWAKETGWANQAREKLVYGLKNTLLGWTEILTEPYDTVQGGGNFFVGVGRGLWNAVGQTAGGALHLVTFPITQIDVPLPEGGTKLLSS